MQIIGSNMTKLGPIWRLKCFWWSIICALFHRRWRVRYWTGYDVTFHKCNYCERHFTKRRQAIREARGIANSATPDDKSAR